MRKLKKLKQKKSAEMGVSKTKRNELWKLSQTMPMMEMRDSAGTVMETIGVSGERILRANPKAECNNQPIKPKGRYMMKIPKTVDHFQRLLDAYKSGGDQAVEEYRKSVITLFHQSKKL